MLFRPTQLNGVYWIDLEKKEDERGFFARTYCQHEFADHALNPRVVQCSTSFNKKKGTLRGMHYQAAPHAEVKVIRCISGAIYDVVLDLRPESSTYKAWVGLELTGSNRGAIYIPAGCAHGFQTLADDTEVYYQISEFYHPESAQGVRWNDPCFGIVWPQVQERIISERDMNYEDYLW